MPELQPPDCVLAGFFFFWQMVREWISLAQSAIFSCKAAATVSCIVLSQLTRSSWFESHSRRRLVLAQVVSKLLYYLPAAEVPTSLASIYFYWASCMPNLVSAHA